MNQKLDVQSVRKKAIDNFKSGLNCAQAVLCAFVDTPSAPLRDITHESAMHLASSFGGGMGRLREVCGAVSGMFMVAGFLFGYDESSAPEAKANHYELIQNLASSFAAKNGAIVCRELLGLPPKNHGIAPDSPVPEARSDAYYKKRPCSELVGDAAEIIADAINERATQ